MSLKPASYVFLLLLLYACSKDDIKIDDDNLLIGTWNYYEYAYDASVFRRSESFIENHCYKFNSDGTLTERKNSGWCGTPPISYANFDGTWKILNDTIIEVTAGYWGGTISYKLDIEQLDNSTLVLKQVPGE